MHAMFSWPCCLTVCLALVMLSFGPKVEAMPTLRELPAKSIDTGSLKATFFPSSFAKCVQVCQGNSSRPGVSNLQSCHHECMLNPHKYDQVPASMSDQASNVQVQTDLLMQLLNTNSAVVG